MPEFYDLPEKQPGESNDEWCRRAAESIPADALLREIFSYMASPQQAYGTPEALVRCVTGHGSGMVNAIVRRFLKPKVADRD